MNYRFPEIYSYQTPPTTAGTVNIPLNLVDPVSMLLIEYKETRGQVISQEHVAACITNISLVDGSDVLTSMTGKEAIAMAHYDDNVSPYSFMSNSPPIQELLGIPINFGRWLGDPMLALDPKQFKNPTLQITHSYRLADASATAAEKLRVIAAVFDDKTVSPSGFLMSKELAVPSWVASASKSTIPLPCDYPFRKLLLRGYLANYMPYQVINHIKLSENNDKKVPMDLDMSVWEKLMMAEFHAYSETGILQANTSATNLVFVTPSYDLALAGVENGAILGQGATPDPLSNPFYFWGADGVEYNVRIAGHEPHSCVPIPFGNQQDPTDWYDVTKLSALNLILTGGAAGSTSVVSVVGQQLRSY
jgi:hypothetical protein